MRLRGSLGTRGAAAEGKQGLSRGQRLDERGKLPFLPRSKVWVGTVLSGQGRRTAALGRGQDRSTAPCTAHGARVVGHVLPLVNWVDALRTPTLAHELIIFIRVHNILLCKAVLFSTPSAKWVIMELKSLVINPSEDPVFWDTRGILLEQRSRQG